MKAGRGGGGARIVQVALSNEGGLDYLVFGREAKRDPFLLVPYIYIYVFFTKIWVVQKLRFGDEFSRCLLT